MQIPPRPLSTRPPRSRRRNLIRATTLVVMLALVFIYGFVARMAFDSMSLPGSHLPKTPTGNYEDVSFPPRGQNYPVYAFYLPGKSGAPALISVHGHRGSRFDDYHLNRAVYLRDLGYSVLSIDLSDNGGQTIGDGRISMGYDERWDVLGAFDYLLTRGFAPERIGLVGESMGASTSLIAAALEPRIRAIWADSGYGRADTVLMERAESGGFSRAFVPGGFIYALLATGDRIWEVTPIDFGPAFATNKQAIYLIHCEPDPSVQYHHSVDMHAAFKAAGVDVTFWSIPDGGHTSGIVNHREEYLQRLDAFFKTHMPD
jgi:dipeptidyl aminopeptidase/acylaminoacyl peptidase